MGKITEDIKKEIIELYKTGIGSTIIAKKYNICNRSVLNILNKIPNLVRPIKIITDEIKKNIIENYLLNVGVVTMSKEFNLSRKTISNILKKAGLLKNRYHSEEFYSQFWEEDGKWWGYWKCNTCLENIKFSVNKKSLLYRNLKNKKSCQKCMGKNHCGKGNPFYGKKHTNETISKMLINQHKVLKPISKAEIEILKQLNDNKYQVEIQKMINKPFDFYLPKYNLLIEYYGDYWHCNPSIYNETYFNKKMKKYAKDIWEHNKNKNDFAKEQGYKCEIIWESDYNKNKNIIIELIKNKYESK